MVVLLLSSFTACTTETSSETDSTDKQQVKKEAGSLKLDEHSHYELLKLYKDSHAIELMKTYGAHSLGIRWKTHQGVNTDQLALAFYIDKIKAVDIFSKNWAIIFITPLFPFVRMMISGNYGIPGILEWTSLSIFAACLTFLRSKQLNVRLSNDI